MTGLKSTDLSSVAGSFVALAKKDSKDGSWFLRSLQRSRIAKMEASAKVGACQRDIALNLHAERIRRSDGRILPRLFGTRHESLFLLALGGIAT